MEHIRYKDLTTYTVVIENGEQALIDLPEFYEKVDCEIPENHQSLIYTNNL